jgi:hypothetical protein
MEGGRSFSRFEPSPLISRQAARRSETFGEGMGRRLPHSARTIDNYTNLSQLRTEKCRIISSELTPVWANERYRRAALGVIYVS